MGLSRDPGRRWVVGPGSFFFFSSGQKYNTSSHYDRISHLVVYERPRGVSGAFPYACQQTLQNGRGRRGAYSWHITRPPRREANGPCRLARRPQVAREYGLCRGNRGDGGRITERRMEINKVRSGASHMGRFGEDFFFPGVPFAPQQFQHAEAPGPVPIHLLLTWTTGDGTSNAICGCGHRAELLRNKCTRARVTFIRYLLIDWCFFRTLHHTINANAPGPAEGSHLRDRYKALPASRISRSPPPPDLSFSFLLPPPSSLPSLPPTPLPLTFTPCSTVYSFCPLLLSLPTAVRSRCPNRPLSPPLPFPLSWHLPSLAPLDPFPPPRCVSGQWGHFRILFSPSHHSLPPPLPFPGLFNSSILSSSPFFPFPSSLLWCTVFYYGEANSSIPCPCARGRSTISARLFTGGGLMDSHQGHALVLFFEETNDQGHGQSSGPRSTIPAPPASPQRLTGGDNGKIRFTVISSWRSVHGVRRSTNTRRQPSFGLTRGGSGVAEVGLFPSCSVPVLCFQACRFSGTATRFSRGPVKRDFNPPDQHPTY